MDTLQLQHQMHSALFRQIEETALLAASLLTPKVVASTAAIAQALSATIKVRIAHGELDISLCAPSNTHPDTLYIAMTQHLPEVDRYNRWTSNGAGGHRHVCLARAGRITYTCDSEITLPQSDSESA